MEGGHGTRLPLPTLGSRLRGPLVAVPGAFLIAIAAALWGTDALLRKPLAESTTPRRDRLRRAPRARADHAAGDPGGVRGSHARRPALRRRRGGGRHRRVGDRHDPLHAGVRARRSCHACRPPERSSPCSRSSAPGSFSAERPRLKYGWLLLGGVVGAWLIAFPSPFEIHVDKAYPALLAITAAALWAMGRWDGSSRRGSASST